MKLNIKPMGEANKIEKSGREKIYFAHAKPQLVPKTAFMGSFEFHGKNKLLSPSPSLTFMTPHSSYVNFHMSSASVIKSLFWNIFSAILGKIMGLIAPKYHLECRVHDKGGMEVKVLESVSTVPDIDK